MEIKKPIILSLCLLLANLSQAVVINLKDPVPEWEPILIEMAKPSPLKGQFKESRFNRFHKLPKRFEGRLWWDPEIGLCLFYEEPSELIINVLKKGLLKGRPGKPLKPLPSDAAETVMQLFTKLFNWDVSWLQENFTIEGTISETNLWELSLRPLEKDSKMGLSRIVLEGEGGLLNTLILNLRGSRKIEIKLSEQARVDALSESDLHLAFPNHDG